MTTFRVVIVCALLTCGAVLLVESAPQMDFLGGYDFVGLCINNCAQCKKMYGEYFNGQKCGDACIRFRGKVIPDCADMQSISPFLLKLESYAK
jgi:hypothetical protein